MSWEDLGIIDLENIPEGYLVGWPFINAFMVAFQERADYIEGAERTVEYNDLLFDNAQILTSEFDDRLSIFNFNVRSCFNAQWVKEDTWTQMAAFTKAPVTIGGGAGQRHVPGLGLIDIILWDETELRLLLTDEVYDDIFTTYTRSVNFKPSYWSGLYKLIKYVMLFRTLSVANNYDPSRLDPVLVLNDAESFKETEPDLNLSGLVSDSITSPNTSNNSFNNFLSSTAVSFQSRWTGSIHIDSCSVNYSAITTDPFCKTPSLMPIRTLLWRDLGNFLSTLSEEDNIFNNVDNSIGVDSTSEPYIGDITYETINTVPQDPVETGEPIGYKAENRNFPVYYADGNTSVNIAGLTDLRYGYDFTVIPAPDGSSLQSFLRKGRGVNYYLNYATCELPQSDFDFSV